MSLFNKWMVSFPLPSPIGGSFNEDLESGGTGLLSHSQNTFPSGMKLPPIQTEEFLGLHINLGNKLSYSINGISGEIRTCQYNFIYVPQTECEVSVQKGTYESLSIHFPLDYLIVMKEFFPILGALLEKAKFKEPSAISSNHINCSAEMLLDIKYLLENKNVQQTTGYDVANLATEIIRLKVGSFLISCLFDLTNKANQFVSRESDRDKVESARLYLLDHMKERFSADRLAEKVGMEKHKLRRAFKVMFKRTMLDFLNDARLEKAKSLLRDTDLPIEKIGMAIGINKLSNFSYFFKNKYGLSPRALRDELTSDGEKRNKTNSLQ